ncbi:MAG: hypothetical protein K2W93_04050, partial [Burkholderiaceae bacterium]|nr:hypothetical protein [Burkholderiaceae bacterium]
DLPANHELLEEKAACPRGLILEESDLPGLHAQLLALAPQAENAGLANRDWVSRHGLFAPAVQRFLARLRAFDSEKKTTPP